MPNFKGLDLTGKTTIVIGASRGIGAAIAIRLDQRGANVVVNYTSNKSAQRAIGVVKNIEAAGSQATICQASVANVAALGVDANLDQGTEELFQTHFDTNVKGPIFLTQAVIPHIAKGGRVVFVSSAASRLGVAGQTVYGATKAANESCARVWAKELGQSYGITVKEDMQPLIESTPAAARIAEVDDIAPLVDFLCTDVARWATGSVHCANGGLYN